KDVRVEAGDDSMLLTKASNLKIVAVEGADREVDCHLVDYVAAEKVCQAGVVADYSKAGLTELNHPWPLVIHEPQEVVATFATGQYPSGKCNGTRVGSQNQHVTKIPAADANVAKQEIQRLPHGAHNQRAQRPEQ